MKEDVTEISFAEMLTLTASESVLHLIETFKEMPLEECEALAENMLPRGTKIPVDSRSIILHDGRKKLGENLSDAEYALIIILLQNGKLKVTKGIEVVETVGYNRIVSENPNGYTVYI